MSFYTIAAKPRLYSCWVAKRVEPSEEEERENEFLYYRGQAAVVFVLGCEESRTQRRRGERMSLLPLSRPIDRVWLRAGFEKRESIKSSEEGERICVDFAILITLLQTEQDVDIRAGFV
jgi:hypothetical protein